MLPHNSISVSSPAGCYIPLCRGSIHHQPPKCSVPACICRSPCNISWARPYGTYATSPVCDRPCHWKGLVIPFTRPSGRISSRTIPSLTAASGRAENSAMAMLIFAAPSVCLRAKISCCTALLGRTLLQATLILGILPPRWQGGTCHYIRRLHTAAHGRAARLGRPGEEEYGHLLFARFYLLYLPALTALLWLGSVVHRWFLQLIR